jgi:hypothetical protein
MSAMKCDNYARCKGTGNILFGKESHRATKNCPMNIMQNQAAAAPVVKTTSKTSNLHSTRSNLVIPDL